MRGNLFRLFYPHKPLLHARSSPTVGIQIRSISTPFSSSSYHFCPSFHPSWFPLLSSNSNSSPSVVFVSFSSSSPPFSPSSHSPHLLFKFLSPTFPVLSPFFPLLMFSYSLPSSHPHFSMFHSFFSCLDLPFPPVLAISHPSSPSSTPLLTGFPPSPTLSSPSSIPFLSQFNPSSISGPIPFLSQLSTSSFKKRYKTHLKCQS